MIQTNISIGKYSNIQIFVTPWSGDSGKSGDSVVDRPTDLYFWYLCQQTNTKDIAGQSASDSGKPGDSGESGNS